MKDILCTQNVYTQSRKKKIEVSRLYVIDPDGKLILDECGTIGFYEVPITRTKLKLAVKWDVEDALRAVNLNVDIPLRNISLRTDIELERILLRTKCDIYDRLKRFR